MQLQDRNLKINHTLLPTAYVLRTVTCAQLGQCQSHSPHNDLPFQCITWQGSSPTSTVHPCVLLYYSLHPHTLCQKGYGQLAGSWGMKEAVTNNRLCQDAQHSDGSRERDAWSDTGLRAVNTLFLSSPDN